jgi:uncharacterized protein (UPF0276 family)
MTRHISVGIALYPTYEACVAAYPLIETGLVDALEWTVDVAFGEELPDWVTVPLDRFDDRGQLYGHGVTLSPTSRFDEASIAWLTEVARDRRSYRHVTEHWGFSRTRGITDGAPLPLPASEAVVAVTAHALRALREVVRAPVGLENLALALSPDELTSQPAMIARTLDIVDGVLLLDLHNLWCQAVNFERDVRELALLYPLARVRQIHVAGGRWSPSSYGDRVRRDTHDGWVPHEVLELLAWIVPRCPALDVVVLERIPDALADESMHPAFRDELRTIRDVVMRAAAEPVITVERPRDIAMDERASHKELARFQDAVVEVLLAPRANAADTHAALLEHPGIAPFRDQVACWQPRQLEIAIELVGTWSVRSP